MSKHVVRQGECAASIGARFGLTAEELFQREGNEDLRELRTSPFVLRAGDTIDVPDSPPARLNLPARSTARFQANVPRVQIKLKLVSPNGDAAANKRYELLVAAQVLSGQTDGEGFVDKSVSAIVSEAVLRVWLTDDHPPTELTLMVGHLDPDDGASGAQHRLSNLGYPIGKEPEDLQRTLGQFQRDNGLTETGTLDDATRNKLVEKHGV